jgi:pimeloyl-ACP methyl ester carboxylesterase
MRYGPPFDFARRGDGRRLAYQVVGEGGLDLVFLLGWPTHLGLIWENPSFAAFLGKLSSFCRLILFDRLGDGLSDRGPSGHTFDDEMDDLRRVMAAAGSERAAFFGCHTGGRLALLLAATHPDEVSSVVAFGSHPATLRDDDYPWGSTPEEREYVFAMIETSAPSEMADALLALQAPREAADPSVRSWFRMFSASASSPVESIEGIRSLGPVDIRGLLGSIQAPVLVLHRTGDRVADVGASRYMADRIPGARMVELPGDDHLPYFGDQDSVVALTQEFLTGATPVVEPDRVLATVLFTDLVDSTRLAAGLGDRRWHRLLVDHQEAVRQQLGRFRRPRGQDHRGRVPGHLRRAGPGHPGRRRHPRPPSRPGPGGPGGAAHRRGRAARRRHRRDRRPHRRPGDGGRRGGGDRLLADGQGPGRRGRVRLRGPGRPPPQGRPR